MLDSPTFTPRPTSFPPRLHPLPLKKPYLSVDVEFFRPTILLLHWHLQGRLQTWYMHSHARPYYSTCIVENL
jgi:hypothetical protein